MGKITETFGRIFHKRSQAPPAQIGETNDTSPTPGEILLEYLTSLKHGVLPSGYITLDKSPEIQTGIMRIAQLVSIMPIHLMENGEKADKRIHNELARLVDISPSPIISRQLWMQKIVTDMITHGNAYVLPITKKGLLTELRPLPHDSVEMTDREHDYELRYKGRKYERGEMLNFVYNPDPEKPWHGRGLSAPLGQIARSLAQTKATAESLKQNPVPPIIVGVKELIEELQTEEGRERIERVYLKRKAAGQPWIIPAEGFDVKELRPMSLKDLAVPESLGIDTKLAAAIIGVPAFVLGAGEFNRDEWNLCISTTIPPITQAIEQELTRVLLIKPEWHYVIDFFKVMKYDLNVLRTFLMTGFDRGVFNGNEIRSVIGFDAAEGLDEYMALENYIRVKDAGRQKKLKGGGESE